MKTYTPLTTTDAHHIIHEFFSCFHLHEALEETGLLFKWACKEGYYKKSAPGNMLFLVQFLQQLFSAVELIQYSIGKKFNVILPPSALQQPQQQHYTTATRASAWQTLPRHLTAEEYLNPYFVFERFTCLPPWEPVLQELLEHALGNGSIDGVMPVGHILHWQEVMMAVIEAAWLVEVRGQRSTTL